MEDFLIFYKKYLQKTNCIITGSIALQLHGVNINRPIKDVDVIFNCNPNKLSRLDDNISAIFGNDWKPSDSSSFDRTDDVIFESIIVENKHVDLIFKNENCNFITKTVLINNEPVTINVNTVFNIMTAKLDIVCNCINNLCRSINPDKSLSTLDKHIRDVSIINIPFYAKYATTNILDFINSYVKKHLLFWDIVLPDVLEHIKLVSNDTIIFPNELYQKINTPKTKTRRKPRYDASEVNNLW